MIFVVIVVVAVVVVHAVPAAPPAMISEYYVAFVDSHLGRRGRG
jgi:hypothetical protein